MRRWVVLCLLAGLMVFSLTVWMLRRGPVSSITTLPLSSEEKDLLWQVGVEQFFSYSFQLPPGEEVWLDIWIERHQDGETQEILRGGASRKESGTVLISVIEPHDSGVELWSMGMPGVRLSKVVPQGIPKAMREWTQTQTRELPVHEPVLVGVLAASEGMGQEIPSQVFWGDQDALRELLEQGTIYLIWIRVKEL